MKYNFIMYLAFSLLGACATSTEPEINVSDAKEKIYVAPVIQLTLDTKSQSQYDFETSGILTHEQLISALGQYTVEANIDDPLPSFFDRYYRNGWGGCIVFGEETPKPVLQVTSVREEWIPINGKPKRVYILKAIQ